MLRLTFLHRRNPDLDPQAFTKLWWHTNDDAEQGIQSAAATDLATEAAEFLDLAQSPLWLNCEYPQINPVGVVTARAASPLVKLYFPLRQQQQISESEARRHWLQNHGPIIRAHA